MSTGRPSEINVTAMIDVLLVLIIIFMVLAPEKSAGLDAQIPQPSNGTGSGREIVVRVGEDRTVGINSQPVRWEDLDQHLRQISVSRTGWFSFLSPARGRLTRDIASVFDAARGAGIAHVALMPKQRYLLQQRSAILTIPMRFFGLIAAWLAILPSAFGWNAAGHRIIAAIAYANLTPKARARVDELLKQHPDYATILTRNAPADPAGRAREAFLAAAVWPDTIKGDPRFWDDTRKDAHPTEPVTGFPDMKRHTNWHYFDTPYAPDGARVHHQDPPHALSELPRLIREIRKSSDTIDAYDLVWIEHIAGDLHQPLHCVSRFLKSQPNGDAGGNTVFLTGNERNLHSLWDDAAGRDIRNDYVSKYAADAMAAHPAPKHPEKNPKKWVEEGFVLSKTQVYTFGLETGSREHPITLPREYYENAARVAQAQVAVAGYRLAAVLNDRLK